MKYLDFVVQQYVLYHYNYNYCKKLYSTTFSIGWQWKEIKLSLKYNKIQSKCKGFKVHKMTIKLKLVL